MNYEEIKKLIDDMGNSKLDSLDIEFSDGIKISMKKGINNFENKKLEKKQTLLDNTVSAADQVTSSNKLDNESCYLIVSPMVGTFYSRSSADKDPFIKVGDIVKKGETLCIIESMKLMNEIESECDGEVVQICMKDEQIVQYGQALFKIKAFH